MKAHALLLVALVVATSIAAERPRRPPMRRVAVAAREGSMSLAFVDLSGGSRLATGGPAASLDFGLVSRAGSTRNDVVVTLKENGFVITARFGIVVHDSATIPRTATLMAALPPRVGRVRVSIDGVELDTAGRMIAAHLIPERPTMHRLQVDVPNDLTEANAQLFDNVLFTLIPE
jgi:hypothetical protein